MSESTPLESPPRVGTDVDEQVLKIVRYTVAARREADDPLSSPAVRMLAMSIGNGDDHHQTPDPYGFARTLLPFWHWTNPSQGPRQALIPLDQTVGHSWRWHPRHAEEIATGRDVAAFRAFLLHPDRSAGQASSRAIAGWIRPLGLFVMHEGKNRVAFLASEGESWMPAQVTEFTYPAAAELTIYAVEECGQSVFVCVRKERYAVILTNPAWTLPILDAYGVKRGGHLGRADEVLAGVRRGEANAFGEHIAPPNGFDMNTLPKQGDVTHEERAQPIMTHENVRIRYRSIIGPWLTMTVLLMIGGALTRNGFSTTGWGWIGSILLIGACGAFAGFLVCLYRVRVVVIDVVPMRALRTKRLRHPASDSDTTGRRTAG